MKDTLVIPTKDALLALDLVAASIQEGEDAGIALCDTNTYLRLRNIFTFHGVNGPFAQKVLRAAKAEGKRKMLTRQPIHVRYMATKNDTDSLLEHK